MQYVITMLSFTLSHNFFNKYNSIRCLVLQKHGVEPKIRQFSTMLCFGKGNVSQ